MTFVRKLLVNVAMSFTTAAWVMLILGFAHGCDHRIPALGYLASWWLSLALDSIVSGSIIKMDVATKGSR